MPKTKLGFPAEMAKQMKVAAILTNTKLENGKVIGDKVYGDVTYTPQSLVDMVLTAHKVKGNEFDEVETTKEKVDDTAKEKGKSK